MLQKVQHGAGWCRMVQDGAGRYRMVQDGAVQHRLKHKIIRRKTKCAKLTKKNCSHFHQHQVALGSLEQASSIFTFQVF